MRKDWIGSGQGVFKIMGATSHTSGERDPYDYYATDPYAVDLLLSVEDFNSRVWEPACGGGHMSERLKYHGYEVLSTDLVNRGYGETPVDFLKVEQPFDGDIITNPPYRYATEFVYKAMSVVREGSKVAMFLKLLFLESKKRGELFRKYPPKVVYVSRSRLKCVKGGDFESRGHSSAVAYAWFVWEKGFTGDPIIRWIN